MFDVLLPVAVAVILVAVLVIFSRTRRQCESTAQEPRQEEKKQPGEIEDESRPEEEPQKAEKKRKQVEKEAQRKAEEEEQHRRKQEEARARAEDQQQRLDAKARQLEEDSEKAEEERKSLGEETRCRREEMQQEAEGRRLEPKERGGRPRTPTQDHEKQPPQEIKSHCLKPEIICWKRERQWIPALEVPDYLLDKSDLVLHQNSSLLSKDESADACWRLEQASGQIEIYWTEDKINKKTSIVLGEEGCLLFRLSSQNWGRRVKSPSFGSYLAVVPHSWERNEALSGPPPAAPEPTSITGYRGHYFDLEKGSGNQIAFLSRGNSVALVNPNVPRFELVGTRLNDASKDMGDLFGEKPPRIRPLDEHAWKDVETVIVGEEGFGKRRWRSAFSPVSGLIEQDLPPELATRNGGWYFLRFYDTNDDLLESLDFRFVGRLKAIKVHQSSPLPLGAGHRAVSVELFHEPDCRIQPADDLAGSVLIEHQDDKTILTIPPDPTRDKTHWLVGPQDGPQVKVTILVERIWWALGQEDAVPPEWTERRIALQRDQLAATSKTTLWLRLPRQRWAGEVLFGFEQQRARRYKPRVTEETLAVPLRDFGDAEELQALGASGLKLWISSQGTMQTAVLGELIVKLACKFCDFSTTEKKNFFSHVESHHIAEFIQSLTYDEMRARIPSLPPGIYKCFYCGFYVNSDDPKNPTSTIIKHQEEKCIKAREEARLRGSSVQVRFAPISDVDEIRENVINNLPRIYRCNLCGVELADPNKGDEMQHLTEHHENVLYDIR